MTSARPALIAAVAAFGLIGDLQAQASDGIRPATSSADTAALCWHARPKPSCKAFFMTNFSVDLLLAGRGFVDGTPYRLVADWGPMFNRSPRDAVGASLFASVEKGGVFAVGPAIRYRSWIGPRSSLDLAVGVVVAGNQESGSVFCLVKYSPAQWIGVALRPEIVRSSGFAVCTSQGSVDCPKTRISGGIEFGGVPGTVLTMIPALFILMIAAGGGIHFTLGS